MRRCSAVVLLVGAGLLAIFASGRSHADHQPSLAVPGRLAAPILVEGHDAIWGVVEGDWGLYRPGHVGRTVYPYGVALYPSDPRFYFPSTGKRPRAGRHEVRVRSKPRAPAQTFYRSWSTDAAAYPPAVIVAPRSW